MPSWIELFGFVTGAACVALLVRQNIWNWPLGILNNVAFTLLFYRSGLYADVGLQGFYIAISAYGWWSWLHGGKDHGALKVSRVKPMLGLGLLAIVVTMRFRQGLWGWLQQRLGWSLFPTRRELLRED